MTTIRVLFLTNDGEYCHRAAPYFAKYHPDIKPTFSASVQGVSEAISKKMYNVVLVGEEFERENIIIPSGVAAAYLSETNSGNDINGLKSYCKYKSGDALYRIILSMFADVSNIQTVNANNFRIAAFTNANGGAGSTTIAAAYAYRQALLGKKTLFFSFDPFADCSDYLFDITESGTLSDMIFIVKSGTAAKNASLKAAALLKKDVSGVKFIDNCKDPYDFEALTAEHIEKMVDIISSADEFEYVVVDGSIFDERFRKFILNRADELFIVAENEKNSKSRLTKLLRFLSVLDKRENKDLVSRSALIFNKNSGASLSVSGISVCGSVPKYKDSNVRNIANAASRLNIWDNL